ncbi:MAG: SH3 domain-containing protein [Maritimibacter sp.]|nr:SH3 domain-containing protein [Maritimibacter sp.]
MNRRAFLARATALGAMSLAGPASADALVVNSPGDGYLNLRTGPGTGFDIVFAMPHGSQVYTLEWSGPWVRVRHETGRTGWCAADFLARIGPERLTVHSALDGFLNLRTGPGTGYAIILQMHNDDRVEVLGGSGNWRQVRHESGAVGWAHRRYLID